MISFSKIFNRTIMKIMKIPSDKKLVHLKEDKNKSIQIPDTDGIGEVKLKDLNIDEIIIYDNEKGLDK